MSEQRFYLQDSRSFCGNAVFWWAKDGRGYTTNLSEASGPSQEDTAGSEAPKPCNEVRPGSGYCDMCSQGRYERCRYVVPQKQLDALRAAEIRGMERAFEIIQELPDDGSERSDAEVCSDAIRAEIAHLKERA